MFKFFVVNLFVLGFALGVKIGGKNDPQCPPNYSLHDDGFCYRLLTIPVGQSEGLDKCKSEGAVLPEITDTLQNEVIRQIAKDSSVSVWLGLSCSSNTNCKWGDGTSLSFNNFDNGTPDVSRGACVFMNIGNSKEGYWTSAECETDFKAVICQKSLTPPEIVCPTAFIKGSDGRCYFAPNIPQAFDNAEQICSDTASTTYLASITNDDSNNAVRLIADSSRFTNVLIGLRFIQGGFQWADGTPFTYSNFTNGRPNLQNGDCVAMNVASGQWYSVSCNTQMYFICLKENIPYPVSSTTTTTPSPSSSCPVDNTFSGPDGIESPNYPHYYGGSIECEYHLYVPAGSLLIVKFYEFYLKNVDYIDLFEGDSDQTLLFRLQGNVSPNQWYSTRYSNRMLVRFVSKPGMANVSGWVLFFKAQDGGNTLPPSPSTTTTPNQPDNTYYGSGTITSPNYPNLYPNNLNATYILKATPGSVIRITFNRINTERCCDVITVFDGPLEDNSKVITSLSGDHNSPETYQSTGTYMTIRFLTDPVLEETGFTADFISYNSGGNPQNQCQDGWTHDPYQQYCYKYFPNGGPWSQNLRSCNNLGGQLLTIHNASQEAYIENFIYNSQLGGSNSLVWIGLHYQFNDWGWSDGTALGYNDWMNGEPSIAGDCAAIQTSTGRNGWKVVDCNTVYPYICYHEALSL